MAAASLVLFPDTNFFVECKDPNECPWVEITEADEITLAVCGQVRSEIDNLKSAGRGRKSERAKAWAGRFRQASRSGGFLELRASNPRVLLLIPPPAPPVE